MKRSDIVVGGRYAWQRSRWYSPVEVEVLALNARLYADRNGVEVREVPSSASSARTFVASPRQILCPWEKLTEFQGEQNEKRKARQGERLREERVIRAEANALADRLEKMGLPRGDRSGFVVSHPVRGGRLTPEFTLSCEALERLIDAAGRGSSRGSALADLISSE